MENQIKYCHWFADNNRSVDDLKSVKKCRYGIRCAYLHLSQHEVNQIRTSGNETVDCSCKEYDEKDEEKIDESRFDISSEGLKLLQEFTKEYREKLVCSLCGGCGQTKLRDYILDKCRKRLMDCTCHPMARKRVGTVYYPKNSGSKFANCLLCNRCNCLVSLG